MFRFHTSEPYRWQHEEGFKVVRSNFKQRIETLLFENKWDECLLPSQFLKEVELRAIPELKRQLTKHSVFKFNMELLGQYAKLLEDQVTMPVKSFQTKMCTVISEKDL
ncbi:uncharacterized protein LOC112905176 [Agrilus planipennis]|uniref:Uncharacterized protein LOC112905176 n=1 Tax=Agrilus planipennis TaxID=224129 RepID=A0A7F5RA65_AGRPL|nr:uncharacterized protein LOC112905176 [Agrilus planipennis]